MADARRLLERLTPRETFDVDYLTTHEEGFAPFVPIKSRNVLGLKETRWLKGHRLHYALLPALRAQAEQDRTEVVTDRAARRNEHLALRQADLPRAETYATKRGVRASRHW